MDNRAKQEVVLEEHVLALWSEFEDLEPDEEVRSRVMQESLGFVADRTRTVIKGNRGLHGAGDC